MTGKRGPNNEGSYYQRSSDNRWVAAVTVNGRRKVRYAKPNDEKGAKKALRDLLAEVEAGNPMPAGRTPTLGQYLERWIMVRLPADVEAGRIRRSTADSYETKLRLHVLGTDLAAVRLNVLSPDDFRQWQTEKLRSKSARGKRLAARTVAYCHAIIRRALNDGVRDNKLPRNVAALVPLPAGAAKPAENFDEEKLQAALVEALADKLRVLWLVMLGLGLRKGEALALRWSRIDLKAGTVKIKKQIYRERGDLDPRTGRHSTRLVEADTKTPDSKATMLMPAAIVELLREHRREQRRARMAARVWADPDLVFTTAVGTAIEPRNLNRSWTAVCARAGVEGIRPHDLRHAAASLAFAEGASIKQVQEMLRHSREATTSAIYVHLLESVKKGTADKMDGVLRRMTGS